MDPPLPNPGGAALERLTVGIVGCGAVGRAFALALARRGARVRLWSRRSESVRGVLDAVGRCAPRRAAEAGFEELGGLDAVLLCVHDDKVAELARRLAAQPRPPGVTWHTCGYFGIEILEPLRAVGGACGKLHPLLALPRESHLEDALGGGVFCIGGDGEALALARRIVSAFEGRELLLKPGEASDRLYHAAAALLSGGFVALLDASVKALAHSLDLEGEQAETLAQQALTSLLESTQTNLRAGSRGQALTGPVARGAEAVVAGHLAALADVDPQAEELYRALGPIMSRLGRYA